MASTTQNDRQAKLDTALNTLKAGGEVYINKYSRARQRDGKIYTWNPQVVTNGLSLINGDKARLANAIKAGNISIISKADLAAGLNPTPSVPKPVGSKKPKRTVKGKADDDNGKKKKKPKVKLRKEADPELATGKRLKNPLGALSSYNYQISLYMITPDALELFKQDGYKNISKVGVMAANAAGPGVDNNAVTAGAYIIAQSGGVNNEFENRAPSFGLDYYIDSLAFEVAGPKETGSPVAEYNFNLKIIEPYGFSFISNLKRAAEAVKDYTTRLNKKKAAVAKKKAAAQQQRTRRRDTGQPKQLRFQESLGESIKRIKGELNRPKYRQNAPFQSDKDLFAPLRGKNPTKPCVVTREKYLGKSGSSGSGNSAGKPKGTDKNSGAASTPYDPTKNIFVLGIRFFGYDASGHPVRGTDITAATNSFGVPIDGATQEIDPGNNSFSLFERYYPVTIASVATTVDGRATSYDIVAQGLDMSAIGTKRGIINNKTEFTAETVGEALDKLMTKLNKEQEKNNKNSQAGYNYDLKYASAYDADRIRNCKIVSKADLDKYKWPGSGAKNTKESNANTETKKGNKPKNNARKITLAEGTPILQAINQIIAQSSFLEDALKTVFTTALEPDQEKEDLPALDNSGKKTIEWFQCTPDIGNLTWSDKTADWVYDINYVLNIYDTPVLDTAYTNPGTGYYGPVKRYDYWYSGTNTEILRYEQKLDTAFYSVFLSDEFGKDKNDKKGGTNAKEATNGSGNSAGSKTSLVPNQRTGQPTQGKQGVGMEAQNGYLTSLFDPNAQAMATVTILGDPDWLMATTNTQFGQNESTVYNKFYGGDGYSISPAGGQIFFEIDFKEAVDYKSEGTFIATKEGGGVSGAPGTLSLNSSILFWKDPKSLSTLVKGLSYTCQTVRSEFRQGVFRQTLSGTLNSFGDAGKEDTGAARENKNKSTNSGPNRTNSNATTSNKGQKAATGTQPPKIETANQYIDRAKATQQGNYQNSRFQSKNDLFAGLRGTTPGSKPKNTPET